MYCEVGATVDSIRNTPASKAVSRTEWIILKQQLFKPLIISNCARNYVIKLQGRQIVLEWQIEFSSYSQIWVQKAWRATQSLTNRDYNRQTVLVACGRRQTTSYRTKQSQRLMPYVTIRIYQMSSTLSTVVSTA